MIYWVIINNALWTKLCQNYEQDATRHFLLKWNSFVNTIIDLGKRLSTQTLYTLVYDDVKMGFSIGEVSKCSLFNYSDCQGVHQGENLLRTFFSQF